MLRDDIVIGGTKKLDAEQRESMKGDIYQSPRGGYFIIIEVKPNGSVAMNGVRRDRNNDWWKTTVDFTLPAGWQSTWRFILKHGNYNLIR